MPNINQAVNVFNNLILTRNRQLPDDDRMIETCRSIFKSFNVNNLSVCALVGVPIKYIKNVGLRTLV